MSLARKRMMAYGCVAAYSIIIFVFLMVSVVGKACSKLISLSATSMMGLTAREM